ncbi:uncharacterized protein TNCV_2461801 [Trichonephila clavipes]|nr:uncharacterized protein TNCV_2461801 [Trichonephila clavipes]
MNMKRKENFQKLPKELHQLKYEAISVPQGSFHLVKKTQERKSSTCYLLITKGVTSSSPVPLKIRRVGESVKCVSATGVLRHVDLKAWIVASCDLTAYCAASCVSDGFWLLFWWIDSATSAHFIENALRFWESQFIRPPRPITRQPFSHSIFHHFDFVTKCLIATLYLHVPTTNQVVPSPPRTTTPSGCTSPPRTTTPSDTINNYDMGWIYEPYAQRHVPNVACWKTNCYPKSPHQVALQHIHFCTVQSITKLSTGSPKMKSTCLNRQYFAVFLLNRHYNLHRPGMTDELFEGGGVGVERSINTCYRGWVVSPLGMWNVKFHHVVKLDRGRKSPSPLGGSEKIQSVFGYDGEKSCPSVC